MKSSELLCRSKKKFVFLKELYTQICLNNLKIIKKVPNTLIELLIVS